MPYREQALAATFFRAYDIRGIIDDQFNVDAFYTIGRAISVRLRQLQRQQIYLARDGRLSSAKLAQALTAGLLASGVDVIDLGALTSPALYFATATTAIDSGVIVTASHNPAHYNGIKIILAGKTLTQPDIHLLHQLVEKQCFINGQGQYAQTTIVTDYQQNIVNNLRIKRRYKIVVDCGNGIAGPIVPPVLMALGCDVIPLYCEVDGHFPHHHPDPAIEDNLRDLKQAVHQHQADLGLAFDGDADRLGVVTDQGEIIWPDRLLMFYARDLLARHQKATIVFDVKCSLHLKQLIEQAQGKAIMCPSGHSIVKATLEAEQALLAGEMSGHLFFKERWYGFDDALYSACRLLELLSHSELTISEQFASLAKSIATPELHIPIAEHEKHPYMQAFRHAAHFPNAQLITIDGVRAEFAAGWGLLRASNTMPCLIARFEAHDESSLHAIKQLFREQMLKLRSDLMIPF